MSRLRLPPLLSRHDPILVQKQGGGYQGENLYPNHLHHQAEAFRKPRPPPPRSGSTPFVGRTRPDTTDGRPGRTAVGGRPTVWVAAGPAVADLEEELRVVGDDAVDALADAPLHPLFLVHGPDKDPAVGVPGGGDEAGAARSDQDLLEKVEVDVGLLEELGGVGERPADVGCGKFRDVFLAEIDVLKLE